MTEAQKRMQLAVDIAARFGAINGREHKQWVIDQMLRALLGDGYQTWRDEYDCQMACQRDDYYPPWDEGTEP